jgi:hypothetical protein
MADDKKTSGFALVQQMRALAVPLIRYHTENINDHEYTWGETDYDHEFKPPPVVLEPKCDCGTVVAMGKDYQVNMCSDWCSTKDNKK